MFDAPGLRVRRRRLTAWVVTGLALAAPHPDLTLAVGDVLDIPGNQMTMNVQRTTMHSSDLRGEHMMETDERRGNAISIQLLLYPLHAA